MAALESAGYIDEVMQIIAGENPPGTVLKHRTEAEPFAEAKKSEIGETGQEPSCRPVLSECPLGCGHAHVEHPHLNMMYE